MTHPVFDAETGVLMAALRVIAQDYRNGDTGIDPDTATEAADCSNLLALAARRLVTAIDALPGDQRPAPW